MRKLVALTLLLCAALAVRGAEQPISDPAVGPAPFLRFAPRTASNGNGFLTVWTDEGGGIFGMRSDVLGEAVDTTAFRISPAANVGDLHVASNGDSYLIAYVDPALIAHFINVDAGGRVTPLPATIPIAAATSLTWSGSVYVFGYHESSIAYAAVLDANGTLVSERVHVVTGAALAFQTFRVSAGFEGRLVGSWFGTDRRIHYGFVDSFQLRDRSWTTLTAKNATTPGSALLIDPAVAVSDVHTMFVWNETTPAGVELRMARYDRFGRQVGTDATLAVSRNPIPASVVWTGANFVVAYVEGTRIATIRITPEGTIWPRVFVVDDVREVDSIRMASGPHSAYAVWSESPSDGAATREVRGALISESGQRPGGNRAGVLLSRSLPEQSQVDAAWCGSSYRAVWVDRYDRARVLFGRIAPDGTPLDGAGVTLRLAETGEQEEPAIACSADHTLVVWRETASVSSVRASLFGAVVAPDATVRMLFSVADIAVGSRPAIVWNGSEYLVAWQSADTRQLMLERYRGDGLFIGVPQPLHDARPGLGDTNPTLAWNGSEYVLAYQAERLASPSINNDPKILHNLEVVRLSRDLNVLSPVNRIGGTADEQGFDSNRPEIAANASGVAVVTWAMRSGFTGPTQQFAARITAQQITTFTLGDAAADYDVAALGNVFRVVFGKTIATIAGTDVAVQRAATASDRLMRVIPGGPVPLTIYARATADESRQRLYVDASPGRRRASR